MMMNARRAPGGYGPTGRFFGPGELRLAVLALIAERPGHGYDLMNRLSDRFNGTYEPSAGSIYPTLQLLEDEGLVRVEQDEGRKVHHVTDDGRRAVEEQADEIERLWGRAASRGEWGMFREPEAAEIVGPALRMVKAAVKALAHTHGDPQVVERIQQIFVEARHRIEELDPRRGR
ncbi:PadR family transcriptional regulator [Nonomuraea wenchangensis]|uniref:Transcriptional regulator PadR-like family protein n=1 Tax=Nonomuraea wenchangensis TaxID=568860 RepID=A0A1I0D9N0_9ACTN|nr:PadR family transcriptional regulator [Nonomuraea wenchangensis]SET28363.1 Transcriptional regulator PadR-like family protein [Nonomuraea wenchangensis]